MTTSALRGSSRWRSLRLCSRAPETRITSCGAIPPSLETGLGGPALLARDQRVRNQAPQGRRGEALVGQGELRGRRGAPVCSLPLAGAGVDLVQEGVLVRQVEVLGEIRGG